MLVIGGLAHPMFAAEFGPLNLTIGVALRSPVSLDSSLDTGGWRVRVQDGRCSTKGGKLHS